MCIIPYITTLVGAYLVAVVGCAEDGDTQPVVLHLVAALLDLRAAHMRQGLANNMIWGEI